MDEKDTRVLFGKLVTKEGYFGEELFEEKVFFDTNVKSCPLMTWHIDTGQEKIIKNPQSDP